MWLFAVKLKHFHFSSLCLLLVHYLTFKSALFKADSERREGEGDGTALMTGIRGFSGFRQAASRFSQQNI